MRIDISTPTPEDVKHMAEHLRPIDVIEAWLLLRRLPLEALDTSVKLSDHSFIVKADGEPVILYGVNRIGLSDEGVVWMVATPRIKFLQKVFLRKCKKEFLSLTEGYEMVYNYVYEHNTIALSWLKWLGFDISSPTPSGFCRVEYRKQVK